jgi:hypothetical protein
MTKEIRFSEQSWSHEEREVRPCSAATEHAAWDDADYQRARDCMIGILRGKAWTISEGSRGVDEFDNAFQHAVGILSLTARIRDAAQAVRAPSGYALVPLIPTRAMLEAGTDNNPTQWTDGTDPGFAIDVANDIYVSMVLAAQPPAAPVEIPGFTIDALRKQAFRMPPADQYKLACFIAENVGYILAREPEHPDSPHNHSSAGTDAPRDWFADLNDRVAQGLGAPLESAEPDVEERISVLSDALKSIAKNTCCDNCQEAALVARSALGAYVGLAREPRALPQGMSMPPAAQELAAKHDWCPSCHRGWNWRGSK